MEKLNSTVQRIHERIEKNYIHLCKMLDMPKHRNKMSIAALPTVNVQCVYCTNRMLVIFCGLAIRATWNGSDISKICTKKWNKQRFPLCGAVFCWKNVFHQWVPNEPIRACHLFSAIHSSHSWLLTIVFNISSFTDSCVALRSFDAQISREVSPKIYTNM